MKTADEIKIGLECCTLYMNGGEAPDCCDACSYKGDCGNLIVDATSLVQQLEAQVPRWISVEERLPEPFVPVLVHMPGEKPHPTVREGYVTRKGKWYACLYDRDPDEVTHWMPLPEPPKEE